MILPDAEQVRTGPFWEAPELVKAGYWVFPVRGKVPMIAGSFHGSSNHMSDVAEWIQQGYGTHDLAMGTGFYSRVVAIDADTPEAFEEMKAKYGPPTYTTKRGGHWLFLHPRNGRVVSTKIAPGLDRKGDGGIAVVPPSKGREWTNGIPRVEDLPALPREFWSKTKGPTPGERTMGQERKDAAAEVIAKHVGALEPNASGGGRHEHLTHLCGVMLGRNVSLVDAEDILKAAWGAVGGDLSERAEREVPNTLSTTQQATREGRATGIPNMEKITPGLFDELAGALGWTREIRVGGKGKQSEEPGNPGNPGNPTPPITAADLMAMTFEPTRWVVPGVLPEGLSLLVGKPKKGKSWMALGMCEAVAVGGVAFGTRRVEQGDTLYLALEDNTKRLQKRLRKVLDKRAAPEKMHLHTAWPRLDEGGAEQLDEWLTEHPEARLVVIDTLAKIRKPAGGANIYAEDYAALELLLPLAAKHGVAIVVVHHLRKMAAADPMDEISSSTGLTAGVDGFLILRRTPGSKGPTLYVDGRDIEEPTEYALHWNINTATWTIEGDAEAVHLSRERGDILLTLNRSPEPMTPKEVADVTPGGTHSSVKKLMWTMLGDGQLIKDDKGSYSPTNPTNHGNPGNPGNPGNSGNRGNPPGESPQESFPPPAGLPGLPGGPEGGNPTYPDRYGEYDGRVTGVTGVTGAEACPHGIPTDYPCDDCDAEERFGGGE
jgi:hypothetical protein